MRDDYDGHRVFAGVINGLVIEALVFVVAFMFVATLVSGGVAFRLLGAWL